MGTDDADTPGNQILLLTHFYSVKPEQLLIDLIRSVFHRVRILHMAEKALTLSSYANPIRV
jgi:hypothetical protein